MKQYQRWPIPEALLGLNTGRYEMRIDSLLAEAYNVESMIAHGKARPDIDAPYNSIDSAENDHDIFDDEATEESDALSEDSPMKNKTVADPDWFDQKILVHSPWRLASMKFFPYKSREGEVPMKLLKVPKLEFVFEMRAKLAAQ